MSSTYASVTSSAFQDGANIPEQYSCKGQDISPPLAWSGAPANTKSFALICADPDAPAGTWYHWVLYNIPANTKEIIENQTPEGALVGKNSWGNTSYQGPCPPSGTHHYIFTLYALDTILNLNSAPDAKGLENAMKGHILQSSKITGLFTK